MSGDLPLSMKPTAQDSISGPLLQTPHHSLLPFLVPLLWTNHTWLRQSTPQIGWSTLRGHPRKHWDPSVMLWEQWCMPITSQHAESHVSISDGMVSSELVCDMLNDSDHVNTDGSQCFLDDLLVLIIQSEVLIVWAKVWLVQSRGTRNGSRLWWGVCKSGPDILSCAVGFILSGRSPDNLIIYESCCYVRHVILYDEWDITLQDLDIICTPMGRVVRCSKPRGVWKVIRSWDWMAKLQWSKANKRSRQV